MRSPELRRSALFVAGADADIHAQALRARPDMLIQDLEDGTPAQLRQAARQCSATLFAEATRHRIVAAVRINTLESTGREDLAAVMAAQPQVVFLPKCASGAQVAALARELDRLEAEHRLPLGAIEIVPNAETAAGVMNLKEIAQASARVKSALLGTEDLAADLMAERSVDAEELAYARGRFLLECRALGIEPIDAPFTFADAQACEREARRSRKLGYRSKSVVLPDHVAVIHDVFTPSEEELTHAREMVQAFEQARAEGKDRALVKGLWIEPPTYLNAKRLLERARQLAAA
jgi:citrate lyase subunit beta / citryl-CoA lyase